MNSIYNLQVETLRKQLMDHPMYKAIRTADRVRVMMKHHAFAVWDFMSLLKNLQRQLTCVQVPWMPTSHPQFARFINEIVLGEETDEDGEGGYISHFELYIRAMEEVDADTGPILSYLEKIDAGAGPLEALKDPSIPPTAADFVRHSLDLAMNGQPHEVASAFFFSREDLIPDMFTVLIEELSAKDLSPHWLQYYLERHIELDGDEHGPLAKRLLTSLCGNDPTKTATAGTVAARSLEARIRLWDGVLLEIEEKGL